MKNYLQPKEKKERKCKGKAHKFMPTLDKRYTKCIFCGAVRST